MAAHKGVGVVEFGTGQEVHAGGIDKDAGVVVFDHDVLVLGGMIEVKPILEAVAAAGQNLDSQGDSAGLSGHDFRDVVRRAVGQAEGGEGFAVHKHNIGGITPD